MPNSAAISYLIQSGVSDSFLEVFPSLSWIDPHYRNFLFFFLFIFGIYKHPNFIQFTLMVSFDDLAIPSNLARALDFERLKYEAFFILLIRKHYRFHQKQSIMFQKTFRERLFRRRFSFQLESFNKILKVQGFQNFHSYITSMRYSRLFVKNLQISSVFHVFQNSSVFNTLIAFRTYMHHLTNLRKSFLWLVSMPIPKEILFQELSALFFILTKRISRQDVLLILFLALHQDVLSEKHVLDIEAELLQILNSNQIGFFFTNENLISKQIIFFIEKSGKQKFFKKSGCQDNYMPPISDMIGCCYERYFSSSRLKMKRMDKSLHFMGDIFRSETIEIQSTSFQQITHLTIMLLFEKFQDAYKTFFFPLRDKIPKALNTSRKAFCVPYFRICKLVSSVFTFVLKELDTRGFFSMTFDDNLLINKRPNFFLEFSFMAMTQKNPYQEQCFSPDVLFQRLGDLKVITTTYEEIVYLFFNDQHFDSMLPRIHIVLTNLLNDSIQIILSELGMNYEKLLADFHNNSIHAMNCLLGNIAEISRFFGISTDLWENVCYFKRSAEVLSRKIGNDLPRCTIDNGFHYNSEQSADEILGILRESFFH